MAADSIQDYLIGLGFEIDQHGLKKFNAALAESANGFLEVGTAAVAAASAVGIAVEKVASQYQDLFYLSQRTGSTVQALQATAYGFTQIGLNAGDAKSMVDGLAMALRTNPGNGTLLAMLGVHGGGANSEAMELVDRLRHMPFYIASQYASMFGISPHQLLMMEQGYDKLKAAQADSLRRQKEGGVDLDSFSKKSLVFMNDLGQMTDEFYLFGVAIARDFIDPADHMIKFIEHITEDLLHLDKSTHGATTSLIGLTGAFTTLIGLKKSAGWIAGLFGAKAAAGAAPAIGEAAAAGGWLSALFGFGGLAIGGAGYEAYRLATDPKARASAHHNTSIAGLKDKWHNVLRDFGLENGGTSSAMHGNGGKSAHGGGWWTPARQKHAMEVLVAGGLTPLAAAALVSRWKNVESPNGPGSWNNIGGGHWGIAQWDHARAGNIWGDTNFDDQLHHVVKEMLSSERAAKYELDIANTPWDAARGATAYERAAGWNPYNSTDDFTARTAAGISNITPLGADTASAKGDVNLNQNTTITVHGSDDPKTTADHVLRGQQNVNADLVRNAGTTVR